MAYAKIRASAPSDERIIAIYVRVSTGYQVDKDSLPFQKKELKAYCKHSRSLRGAWIEITMSTAKATRTKSLPS